MTRGRIPFARRRGPGVNVSPAFGNDAEFQRRTDREIAAGANCNLEIIDGRLVEVRLGRDGGNLRTARARANGLTSAPLIEPRAFSDDAAVQPPGGWRVHHAQARHPAPDKSDVDGVIVPAADELFGAVERVDEE